MNVLWVSPWLPSPMRPRTHGLLSTLSGRGHNITLVGLDLGERESPSINGVDRIAVPLRPWSATARALGAASVGRSISGAWVAEPIWLAKVDALLARGAWDVVHCEHVRGLAALPWTSSVPLVWDAVDCVSDLYTRLAQGQTNPFARLWRLREARAIADLECRGMGHAAQTLCTTDSEALRLRHLAPDTQPIVVPNGVTIDPSPRPPNEGVGPAGAPVVVCSGRWRHPPNRDAVDWVLQEVWPRLRRQVPSAELWIVGADPPGRWDRSHGVDGVRLFPNVPDMRDVLRQAHVSLCPVRVHAGIQNKILEALSVGVPVVSLPISAEPVAGAVGCGAVEVAVDSDAFVAKTVAWLRDPVEARRCGEVGREWAVRTCRWSVGGDAVEAAWQRAAR